MIGGETARLTEMVFESGGRSGVRRIPFGDDLRLRLHLSVDPAIPKFNVWIGFSDFSQRFAAQITTQLKFGKISNLGDEMLVEVHIPRVRLSPGIYGLTVCVYDEFSHEPYARYGDFIYLEVVGRDHVMPGSFHLEGEWNASLIGDSTPTAGAPGS